MALTLFKGAKMCPMCGHAEHPIDRIWECPMVQKYECWSADGGWTIEKYPEDDVEVIFEGEEEESAQ